MGNRLWITAETPEGSAACPRVRAADDFEDTGWVYLPREWAAQPPLALLEEAWKRSPKIASILADSEENETDAYLNDGDFHVGAFLAQARAHKAARARAEGLEAALPSPAATSPSKPRL